MSAVLRETIVPEISRNSKYIEFIPPAIILGGYVPIVNELRAVNDLAIAHYKLESISPRLRDTTQAYFFDAIASRERREMSRIFLRDDADTKDPRAVVLLSRGSKHIRLHVNTPTTTDALAVLPEVQYLMDPGSDEFRFTIPVPSRRYSDRNIVQHLKKLGWEKESKGQIIAIVVWDGIDSFQRYAMPKDIRLRRFDPIKEPQRNFFMTTIIDSTLSTGVHFQREGILEYLIGVMNL